MAMIAIRASAFSTLVIDHRSRTAKEDVAKTAKEIKMVGTTGFEPATSRTPSVRATRLRYVPTGKLTATGQQNQKAESGRESAPPRYHRRSSSVKKAWSVSRRSSSILRLRSCPLLSAG